MINCIVTSFQKTDYYKDMRSITLPAFSGQMQILPNHAEAFILLSKGDIIFKKQNSETEKLQITKGVCHFKNNNLIIIS